MLRLVLLALPLVPLAAAEDAPAVEAPAVEAPAVEAPAVDPVAALMAESDKSWWTRDRKGVTEDIAERLDAARAADPGNYALHWRAARAYFWLGTATNNKASKSSHGKAGWDAALAAQALKPNSVEGYLWGAACVGVYSDGMGIVTAVKQGLAEKFQSQAERALQLNPRYDNGGPPRALGRYYTSLPWPLQDLDKARTYLEQSYKISPKLPLTSYYLADMELESGNEDKAREHCERVMAMTSATTIDGPGMRMNQGKCKALLADLD